MACHGPDVDPLQLKRRLRNNFVRNEITGVWRMERLYTPQSFPHTRIQGTLRVAVCQTPAGVLHYPLGVIAHNRFIRPLSVDGITYLDNGGIQIHTLLTPLSSGTLSFRSPSMAATITDVSVEIQASGNPFTSVFSTAARGTRVALFHHTTHVNAHKILTSKCMKPSKWNFQGTGELAAQHYIYLTDTSTLTDEVDMVDVGMAARGTKLAMVTDTGKVHLHEVYRMNPEDRPVPLRFWVDWSMIEPNPLVLHTPDSNLRGSQLGAFSWWEVFHSAIFRVPVEVGGSLPIRRLGQRDEHEILRDRDYKPTNGFIAALGNDPEAMLRMWSERPVGPGDARRPADFGQLDPEWQRVARQSLSHLVGGVLQRVFSRSAERCDSGTAQGT